MLIVDTGSRGSGLVDWLADGPPKNIRGIILTHNDADHAGALCSIVRSQGANIQAVHMLQDRPKDDAVFDRLFRCAFEWEQKTGRQIQRLEAGRVLWRSDDGHTSLTVEHPSFSEAVIASNPNRTSALIVLRHKDEWLGIWPGDLSLTQVHGKADGKHPTVMVGPHHGAPEGYKDKRQAPSQISGIAAANVFISVGTHNKHEHPQARYLLNLGAAGCRVRCSELTRVCDREATRGRAPVFDGTGQLGLRTPRAGGVPCRGAWRMHFKDGKLFSDKFTKDHLTAVDKLKRPRCLQSRGWRRGADIETFV